MFRIVLVCFITAFAFITFSVEFLVRQSTRISPPIVRVNPPPPKTNDRPVAPKPIVPPIIVAPPTTQCLEIIKKFELEEFKDSVHGGGNITPQLRRDYRDCTKK